MKIESGNFVVNYEDAKFIFKKPNFRDLIAVVDAQKVGFHNALLTLEERLIAVENVELDGEELTPARFLDLPQAVVKEILSLWLKGMNESFGVEEEDSEKKIEESESEND